MNRPAYLLLITTLLLLPGLALAQLPTPPTINATSHILVDHASGQILSQANADEQVEPASLTKVMTAYVVFYELREGNIGIDDIVRVSEKAWRMGGSRMFIEVNTEVSVRDLLKGMIIQSGNDASVALAEHVAGAEEAFTMLMNQHARRLGMHNSHFVNSHGMPHDDHLTTARDMAILARALINEFPEYFRWYSQREFTYNGIRQHNRNRLLWRDESVDGLKTGHTSRAGYCLAATAEREGMRLITVVMGTASENARAVETQKLLNYGFRFFDSLEWRQAGEPLRSVPVFKGASDQLAVGVDQTVNVVVPRGQRDRVRTIKTIDGPLIAPISAGQRVGTLRVVLGDELLAERPLRALEAVEPAGFFGRLVDRVKLFFAGEGE